MSFRSNKDLKRLVQPFSFALKGGASLDKNLMDFSLMILHMSNVETIPSPKGEMAVTQKVILSGSPLFTPMAKPKKRQPPLKVIESLLPNQTFSSSDS